MLVKHFCTPINGNALFGQQINLQPKSTLSILPFVNISIYSASLQKGLSEFQLFVVFLQKYASRGLHMHDLYFSSILAALIMIFSLFSGMLVLNWQTVGQSSKTEQLLYKILVRLTNFITEGIFQILLCQSLYHFQYFFQLSSYFKATFILIFLATIYFLSLLQFYIGEASLTQFTSKYKRIQKSQLDYIKLIIINLQCYMFIFISNGQLYIQSLLYLAFILTELSRIFMTLNFTNIHQIITKLILLSLGFIICILNFCNSTNHKVIYCLCLTPLLTAILVHAFQYRIETILQSKISTLDPFELNYLLCYQELLFINSAQKKTKVWSAILTSEFRNTYDPEAYYIKNLCFINDNKEITTQQSYIQHYIILQIKENHYKLVTQNIYLFTHFIYLHFAIGMQNETYKLMHHLSHFSRSSYVEKLKIEAFLIVLKNKLQTSFLSKVRNSQQKSNELSLVVQQFIKDEAINNEMRNIIIKIIDRKIKLLHFFQKFSDDNLFQFIQNIISDICKLEKTLEQYLQEFPSEKNLSILTFFLVEVKNDWSKAHELAINGIVNNQTSNDILFSKQKNIIYIRFTYENNILQMVNFSKQTPSFFGYLFQQFNQITDPNILIPGGIREFHNQFMLEFIESGQGLFFKNRGENLCQLKNGFVQTVQFFYDIQFEPNQLFKFLAFFSESEEQRALIIIDENNKISGVSQEFLKMINFPKTIYEEEIIDVLYDIPSHILIDDACINHYQPNFKYKIQFPNTYTYMALKNMTVPQRIHSLKQKRHLSTFMAVIDLRKNLGYKILRIVMVSEIECNLETIVELQDEQGTVNLLNEEEFVATPYNEFYDVMYQIDIHQPLDTFHNNTEKSIRGEAMIQKESNKESFIDGFSEQSINIFNKKSKQVSLSSSAGGLKKSFFVRKYTLYELLSNPKLIGSNISIASIFWITFALLLLCFLIVQMKMISEDFDKIQQYYSQGQVNNYFLEPQQKYQLTQFMQLDYAYLFNHNLINMTQLLYFSEFYLPLKKTGYLECKFNYENHFEDSLFQKYLQNQYVQIKQQIYFYQPIQFQIVNITLHTAFNELLDTLYKNYIIFNTTNNITFNRVSPRSTYQYINYITFIKEFNSIADKVFSEANEELTIVTIKWKLIPIPILIVSVFIIMISLIPIRKQLTTMESLVNLINFAENPTLDSEIDRLQLILTHLKSLSESLFKYKFNILIKEKQLIESQSRSHMSKTKTTASRSKKILKINVKRRFYVILLTYFVSMATFVTQILNQTGLEYLEKFENTQALFKMVSDIGVYIPAAYTQRDMIFYWPYFSCFNETDKDLILQQIQSAKELFAAFLEIDFTKNVFQISDQFFQQFSNFMQMNLCDSLNKTLYHDSDNFCKQSRSGILERGLRTVISDYKNELDTELLVNFTQRTIPSSYELEAVYMSSNLISKLSNLMIQDIDVRTSSLQLILKIISIILFLFTLSQFLLIEIYLKPRMKKNIICAKQISFVLPQETIFLNDQYERELRRIAITESLI